MQINYDKQTKETEVLNADDEKIRSMLGNLKRIGAPENFFFHVKARIAGGKTDNFKPGYFPVLRYVLPLSLVVVISAAAVFHNFYLSGSPQNIQPPIAETRVQNQSKEPGNIVAVSQTPEINVSAASNADANFAGSKEKIITKIDGADSQSAPVKSSGKPQLKIFAKENNTEDLTVGSHTSASTGSSIIAPPGLNPNKPIKISPEFENGKSLSAREILLQFGIEAAFTGEGWLVKSVKQYSLAERSGVKPGDVVEAIDGEKISDQPVKAIKIEGKKLTVARGTEKLEIILSNKSN